MVLSWRSSLLFSSSRKMPFTSSRYTVVSVPSGNVRIGGLHRHTTPPFPEITLAYLTPSQERSVLQYLVAGIDCIVSLLTFQTYIDLRAKYTVDKVVFRW